MSTPTDPDVEIARLRAGEDHTPIDPACWPTPGQWIARWNSMTAEERLDCATTVITLMQARHYDLMRPAAQSWHERSEQDITAEHHARGH